MEVIQNMEVIKKCPFCAEEINAEAIKCKHCGEFLDNRGKIIKDKSKNVTGLLAPFLGGLGAHHFYLGNTNKAIVYLLFCWTFIPVIISFFEAISFFIMTEEKFHEQHILKKKSERKSFRLD